MSGRAGCAQRTGPGSPYAQGLRAGIEAGDVVSGSVGSKALGRLDFTVVGDVVSVASYLQSIAQQDQILLGDAARSAISDHFMFDELGPREIPGLADPRPVYAVAQRAGIPDAGDIPETEPP